MTSTVEVAAARSPWDSDNVVQFYVDLECRSTDS